jgi:hypothetical protein
MSSGITCPFNPLMVIPIAYAALLMKKSNDEMSSRMTFIKYFKQSKIDIRKKKQA